MLLFTRPDAKNARAGFVSWFAWSQYDYKRRWHFGGSDEQVVVGNVTLGRQPSEGEGHVWKGPMHEQESHYPAQGFQQ